MMMFTSKNFSYSLFLASFILFCFSACKKEETTDTTVSYLRVINAAPSLATYNAYLNGTLLNAAALPFAGSTAYGAQVAASYSLKFTTASSTESLLTKTVVLNPTIYQSYYLINKPTALDGIFLTDDLSVPATDKAYVRFINLSPDAAAMDLAKTGATTAYTTGKGYKTASGFIAIDPGTFTLNIKETSSGTIKATSESTTFVAAYHYDVICGGLVAPANDTERPLSLRVLTIK